MSQTQLTAAEIPPSAQPRYSKSFTLLSWVPLIGGLAYGAFYFLYFQNLHRPLTDDYSYDPGESPDYDNIQFLANFVLFFMPFIVLGWLGAIWSVRNRKLRLGWFNIGAFLVGWALYFVIDRADPVYMNWFID